MRRSSFAFIAAVSTIAFTQIASAADLPRKAPAYAPPPAFSWTGFYVGGTVGAAWTKSDVSLDPVNGTPRLYDPLDIPSLSAFGSPSINGSHVIFGGKLGYNQQWGAVVLGLEGDISYFHFNKTFNASGNPFITFPGEGSAVITENVSTDWLATLRPRLGYAFDHALLYVTGGLALGKVGFSNNYVGFSPHGSGFEFESSSVSETKAGWTVGGGVDYAITNNWIVSAEYLHVDLGSVSTSGSVRQQNVGALNQATLNFSAKLKSDIGRVGIAYKF